MRSTIFTGALLLFSLSLLAQAPPTAESIIANALKKAKSENKNVIVIFHASWCGWCHKMDTAMNDIVCKKYFTDNYETVHLTVDESPQNKHLENPGAEALKIKYHGEKAGLPFWLVLDKNGKLLADSYMRPEGVSLEVPGDNIGCPAADNEVEAFIKVLKNTSKISKDGLAVIAERFKKNK